MLEDPSYSRFLDCINEFFSSEISLIEAQNMLEEELDRDRVTEMRTALGAQYVTQKVEQKDNGYVAYLSIHKDGLNIDIPIGETDDGEWEIYYGNEVLI